MSNGACRIGDNGTVSACIDPIPGSADPSAGAGVEANPGTLYVRTTDNITTYWIKSGAADTAWTQIVTQTFSGNILADRFLAAADTAALPGHSWQADPNTGIYNEAADQASISVGGNRYVRVSTALISAINAGITAAQQITLSGVQSTSLTANTDNLTLTSVSTLRLTSTGAFNLTGLTAGAAGRYLWVENANAAGGDAITLVHDATSTAANRFSFAGGLDVPMAAQGGVLLRYSGTASRWLASLP